MNFLITQIILAARNRDGGDTGWVQMLILVIVGVVYALVTILKARANKVEEEGEEQLTGKPARKPSDAARSLERQLVKQPPRRPVGPVPRRQYGPEVRPQPRKIVRPQPVARKLAAETEPAIELPALEPPAGPKLSPPTPQLQPKLEELPEFIRYASELSLDYADADKLRRAILHYEILGKPLSLRGPSEHIIGL